MFSSFSGNLFFFSPCRSSLPQPRGPFQSFQFLRYPRCLNPAGLFFGPLNLLLPARVVPSPVSSSSLLAPLSHPGVSSLPDFVCGAYPRPNFGTSLLKTLRFVCNIILSRFPRFYVFSPPPLTLVLCRSQRFLFYTAPPFLVDFTGVVTVPLQPRVVLPPLVLFPPAVDLFICLGSQRVGCSTCSFSFLLVRTFGNNNLSGATPLGFFHLLFSQ